MLVSVLYVAVGAILGALARFLVTHFSSELSHHHGFPYGTLVVNVVGCVVVGYVLTWTADHEHDRWRLLMATGFCGAFTTFSAFAYESMAYWHDGKFGGFALNLFANNLLCFVAVIIGIRLHRGQRKLDLAIIAAASDILGSAFGVRPFPRRGTRVGQVRAQFDYRMCVR